MSTLVDSNVLIDVLSEDARWFEWSARALAHAAERATLCINPVVYAEISVGYASAAALDAVLPEAQFERLPLPFSAGFLAGRAFVEYRRKGGVRTSPLPDFYIGAHALAEGHTLLTRDPARYRPYFPKLKLVSP
ncbi:MAG: type II toxin-antitoxin system VapC family toxin [Opitutaceae bacterium]